MKKTYSYAAVAAAMNIGLFFTKLYIGLSSGSVAIYADSMNNLLDTGVCVAAIIGLVLISRKKSEEYPFGLGKTEDLIEFIISVAITVSGIYFGYVSVERIMYPMPVWFSVQYAVVIGVTAMIKLSLALFLGRNKNGGGIIKGIATDSLMDFFITLCSLISFTLSSIIGYSADGVAGVIISITMTVQGIKALIASCTELTGKNDADICDKAKSIIEKESAVSKIISVSFHKYGQTGVFTANIETDCKTAEEIKDLTNRLGKVFESELNSKIYLSFGGAE